MTHVTYYGEELPDTARARRLLAGFRGELYRGLTARADELSGLTDAVLCADGPVRDLAGLSLAPGHRRGHGAVYDGLNAGRADVGRLRWAVGCVPLASGLEYGVERGGEAGVPVMQDEFHAHPGIFQVHQEVPGLLHYPGLDRVLRGARDPDPAGAVLTASRRKWCPGGCGNAVIWCYMHPALPVWLAVARW